MKVLQINAVYGHGSTGIIVKDIESRCEAVGIDCYVASPDPTVADALNGYRIGNFVDHKLNALLSRICGKQAYYSKLSTRKLLRHIDRIQPDIVHLHNLHSNYINLNLLLAYLSDRNIRTVVTLHDCWYFTGGCFHYSAAGCDKWQSSCGKCPKRHLDTPAILYDASSRILADRVRYFGKIKNITMAGASSWVAGQCRKSRLGISDIRYIHNGVDTDVFKPSPSGLRQQLGLEGKFVILGPATKWMQDCNAEVLTYYVDHLPDDCVLLLFGASVNIPDQMKNVISFGFVEGRQQLAELYSMADVMANVSREDTLSTINLECQACGTPVVSYDATGSAETLDPAVSILVQTGDCKGMLDAVLSIRGSGSSLNSPRQFICDNFNKEENYNSYIELYKEISHA